MTTMMLRIDSKHRLTIPSRLAPTKPGEYFEAYYDADENALIFRRVKSKKNWLDVLKQCPSSMDDLQPRSRKRSKKLKN